MAETESLHYLEKQLTTQIKAYDDSRQFFRQQQFRFTLTTAVFSASTTILIGAEKILDNKWISVLALITSAAITVIAAWDQFLRSRDLWVQKTDTWMALQNLDAHIQYAKSKFGGLTQEQVDDFYTHFDQILMNEHASWKKVRGTQEVHPHSAISKKETHPEINNNDKTP